MSSVSAIVPTHNRAATLHRALASVFGQTRPPDEVIVVDDASTDDTAAVLRDFPAARVVRLERNGGAAHARNEGIRHAAGELIAFLDSDDVWLSHKLELQLAAFAAAPSPDLVCTGITVRGSGGAVAYHGFAGDSPPEGWSFGEFQNYPFCPSTWLVRRSVFGAVGPFDASLPNCEDLDYLARLAGRCRMRLIADPLVVKYNLHDSLDASLARTEASYQALFSRYPALWARAPQAVVASHVRLAGMHARAGDLGRARALLWQTARRHPGRPAPWLLLAASLLGRRAYQRAWRHLA
jgi:glycosyltransferase involved in cell wall biosynthesis